jgi:hypothetical protein
MIKEIERQIAKGLISVAPYHGVQCDMTSDECY